MPVDSAREAGIAARTGASGLDAYRGAIEEGNQASSARVEEYYRQQLELYGLPATDAGILVGQIRELTGFEHLEASNDLFAPLLTEDLSSRLGELYLKTGGCKDAECLSLAKEIGANWLHPDAARARGRFLASTSSGFAKAGLEGPGAAYAVARLLRLVKHLKSLPRIEGRPWRIYRVGESACQSGCERVARAIEKRIGGEIHTIRPKRGLYLGEISDVGGAAFKHPAGSATGWSSHQTVLKDGRVYDYLTGPEGQTVAEYKARWKHADDIEFGF